MSDRHPKWQRVEPGTVIPAGQPYRVEVPQSGFSLGAEYIAETDRHAGEQWPTFVDSSWRPPLVLPTEPTWGIAVWKKPNAPRTTLRQWFADDDGNLCATTGAMVYVSNLADFIPLTDEQVQRIEAAR